MKIEDMFANSRADCTGCEACANACPKSCIAMVRDDEGFAYPKINHEICIQCGKCDATCPALNFVAKMPDELPDVFVAIHHDEKVRRHSSSGGAFTALSEIVLRDGGIIFGAGFNENWQVVHTAAENLDEIENLRGSKYVQSQIGDVYKRVKVELEKGRQVLFSGTPCQCAGLKSFLDKDYPNLLAVDLICHGTPSPKLWESYIEYRAQGHDIASVNFRSKRKGWVDVHFEINFYDCGYYVSNMDIYSREFLIDLILRPSCHECKFSFPNGKSDLTIGDAWGMQNFAPDLFDDRGASLMIVHTTKGKIFLSKVNMVNRPVSFDVLPMFNPMFLTSSIADDRRQNFFDELKAHSNLAVAVMQKFFYENPDKVNESGRNFGEEAIKKYGVILRHLAKKREKNLMLVTGEMTPTLLREFTQYILEQLGDVGVYFLQMSSQREIIFLDGLHPMVSAAVQAGINDMRALIEELNITEIFIDSRINLDESSINFFKSCGVSVENFDMNAG